MSRSRRERGFALLLVLWTLVPISALFLTMAGTARSDGQLAFNLRDAARLQAAADGGIEAAIFGLLQPGAAPAPLTISVGGVRVAVRIESLAGFVNPNIATPELLTALLSRLGAAPDQADRIASAIVDWRTPGEKKRANGAKAAEYRGAGLNYGPPGAPFETIGELRDVLGMTPDLFAALAPNLSLANDRPPEPALAPPLVLAALGDLGISARASGGSSGSAFRIRAAAAAGSSQVLREATVRIGTAGNGKPWRVLSWRTGTETEGPGLSPR